VWRLSLSFLFGSSNVIMYFSISLVRFEVGASSNKGLLDFSVSHFFPPSFWCVSIVFEVH